MTQALRKPHIWIWGVAAVLLAAAFLLVFAPSSRAADAGTPAPAIDLGAPVTDSSQCAPCHLTIGSVKKPGIIFDHGNHIMVSCDGCHSRMPHNNGATDSVPMETCFACHGIKHGPQGELATSVCSKCHTASFDLVPRDHQAAEGLVADGLDPFRDNQIEGEGFGRLDEERQHAKGSCQEDQDEYGCVRSSPPFRWRSRFGPGSRLGLLRDIGEGSFFFFDSHNHTFHTENIDQAVIPGK